MIRASVLWILCDIYTLAVHNIKLSRERQADTFLKGKGFTFTFYLSHISHT